MIRGTGDNDGKMAVVVVVDFFSLVISRPRDPGRRTTDVCRIQRFDNRACETYCCIYIYRRVEVTLTRVLHSVNSTGKCRIAEYSLWEVSKVSIRLFSAFTSNRKFFQKIHGRAKMHSWNARYRAEKSGIYIRKSEIDGIWLFMERFAENLWLFMEPFSGESFILRK